MSGSNQPLFGASVESFFPRDPAYLPVARKTQLAQSLLQQALSSSPAYPMQALARMFQAGVGGWMENQAEKQFGDIQAKQQQDYQGLQGISPLASAMATPTQDGPPLPKLPPGGVPNTIAPQTQVQPPAQSQGTPAPEGAYGHGGAASSITVPPEYLPYYKEASDRTGIPVEVLLAKDRQESGFNPKAKGKAGEIGVAQIMPSTALAPGYGMQPVDPATLTDPRANINFGADYLKARMRGDPRDPETMRRGLFAYNAGGDPNYVANVTRYLPAGYGGAGGQQQAGGPIIRGDSLASADGLGGSGTVGAPPAAVLATVSGEAQKGAYRGQPVVLSSGASNNPADLANVEQQLQMAQQGGASKVSLLGVGPAVEAKAPGTNAQLQALAQKNGAQFIPLPAGDGMMSPDGVHPSAQGYAALKASVAPARGVAARTGGTDVAGPGAPTGQGGAATPGPAGGAVAPPQGAGVGSAPSAAQVPQYTGQWPPPSGLNDPDVRKAMQSIDQLNRMRTAPGHQYDPIWQKQIDARIDEFKTVMNMDRWVKGPDGTLFNKTTGNYGNAPKPTEHWIMTPQGWQEASGLGKGSEPNYRGYNIPGVGFGHFTAQGQWVLDQGVNTSGLAAQSAATAQGTETGKQAALAVPQMRKLGEESSMQIATIDSALGQLRDARQAGVPTGFFAPWLAEGAAMAKSLGVDLKPVDIDPSAVSNIQAARKSLAIVGGGIIRNILGVGSEITEGKLNQFIHATPGIETDPAALDKILGWARSQALFGHDMAIDAMKNVDPNTGMIPPGWLPQYYAKAGTFGPIYDPMRGELNQPKAGEGPARSAPAKAAAPSTPQPKPSPAEIDAELRRRGLKK